MLEMHECFIANILADALQLQFRSPCGWRSIWHSRLTSFKLLNCFDMLALLRACIASWTSNTFCNICVSSLSWGRCIDFRNEGRLRTKRNAAFNHEFNSEYMILQKQETYTARDCAWWFYHDDPRSACHIFCFHLLILASRTHDRRFLQSESSKGVHARLPFESPPMDRDFCPKPFQLLNSGWSNQSSHDYLHPTESWHKSRRVNLRSRPR